MTAYNAIPDGDIDPESPGTTSLFTNLRDNPIAITEGSSGAPKIQKAALATDSVGSAQIEAGAVDSSELASNSVNRTVLSTSAGTVSVGGGASSLKVLPGGEYGFYVEMDNNNNSDVAQILNGGTASNQTVIFLNSVSTTVTAKQRYVTSSPPYDMGDGECGLFVELEVDSSGNVIGAYIAPDPVWAYNGPTDIRPDVIDKNGRAFKRIIQPAVNLDDYRLGRANISEVIAAQRDATPELVEIDAAFKNSDIDVVPHSTKNPTGTIILLDPVNAHDLLELHNNGENLADLIFNDFIRFGNTPLPRSGPPGVQIVNVNWRNTR